MFSFFFVILFKCFCFPRCLFWEVRSGMYDSIHTLHHIFFVSFLSLSKNSLVVSGWFKISWTVYIFFCLPFETFETIQILIHKAKEYKPSFFLALSFACISSSLSTISFWLVLCISFLFSSSIKGESTWIFWTLETSFLRFERLSCSFNSSSKADKKSSYFLLFLFVEVTQWVSDEGLFLHLIELWDLSEIWILKGNLMKEVELFQSLFRRWWLLHRDIFKGIFGSKIIQVKALKLNFSEVFEKQ